MVASMDRILDLLLPVTFSTFARFWYFLPRLGSGLAYLTYVDRSSAGLRRWKSSILDSIRY